MAQQLPVELWTQIHCLACTDDGFAGRALSRVSKDWRSISAPFKFQSIALVGARPILRFVALLDATPEANVESLFVGCARPRPWLTERLILQEERARGLVFSERLFPELGISPETEWVGISMEAIESSVQRILTILAGTLATLHVHVYYPRPSPLFYKLKFPRLRVLVLHGVFGISTNMGSVDSLPALRYLRLSGSPTPGQTIKPSVLLNLIANAAPCLIKVHLTQSALSAELSVVTRDLQESIGEDDIEKDREGHYRAGKVKEPITDAGSANWP
ncbi:hypothetical protein MIND_00437800 [Mycena indigotica]|uniref:F-box domain-containing protein n=1 Tax=Mycena indigotica TaxID=2126181 RepID=A0A8H6W837_9AGAR|nr:uncharacterized protein MIND_00437800 [Mycena indigotica]KAF7306466.1 hypothetical protein MIND_00437800 [Mycena indigotica]